MANHCGGQIYAKRCEVGSNATSCPEPVAKVYDHHEGEISEDIGQEYILYVKSAKGVYPPVKEDETVASIDYDLRGEYLIEYSASDVSGNDADNVHFAMVMVDEVKPTGTAIATQFHEVNNADSAFSNIYALPAGPTVTDAYDGDVTSTLAKTDKVDAVTTLQTGHTTIKYVGAKVVGTRDVQVTYTWNDYASVFGENSANNEFSLDATITLTDETPPVIFCKTAATATSCTTSGNTISCTNTDVDCAMHTTAVECSASNGEEEYIAQAKSAAINYHGAISVDSNDQVDCDGTTCTVTTSPLTGVYTYDAVNGEVDVTYTATDDSANEAIQTQVIRITDTSPPILTVFDSGLFYYNEAFSLNNAVCGDTNNDFYLELLSRGFEIQKTCGDALWHAEANGHTGTGYPDGSLGGIDVHGDATAIDNHDPAVHTTLSLPSSCKVVYRIHNGFGKTAAWRPDTTDCNTTDSTVISFNEMKRLFRGWCVHHTDNCDQDMHRETGCDMDLDHKIDGVPTDVCNQFTQTRASSGQKVQVFSMEYECGPELYLAKKCRLVENIDSPVCHSPTPVPTASPTKVPTNYPTAHLATTTPTTATLPTALSVGARQLSSPQQP
jgi:hypothetical protein